MQSGIVQEDDKTINRYQFSIEYKKFVCGSNVWTPHSNFDTAIWGTSLYEDTQMQKQSDSLIGKEFQSFLSLSRCNSFSFTAHKLSSSCQGLLFPMTLKSF